MTAIRRLDHVAVLVRDTGAAVAAFRDRLGLQVAHEEELGAPPVRLTYMDVGNAYIQLVEPLDPDSEIGRVLDTQGEGVHHVCFAVDDVQLTAAVLSGVDAAEIELGRGRGRRSAFVSGGLWHGVRFECTEFRATDGRRGGALGSSGPRDE